ncbi:hypothetical protein [Lysinibacillus fusiformis]|uniref:hypothetical protein n=1 Tax=Lysinibacillus fusiformis TaxID=28031 RepID=UPI00046A6A91|nr:hypothetical protein [Lysinibacillus fusiformis]
MILLARRTSEIQKTLEAIEKGLLEANFQANIMTKPITKLKKTLKRVMDVQERQKKLLNDNCLKK